MDVATIFGSTTATNPLSVPTNGRVTVTQAANGKYTVYYEGNGGGNFLDIGYEDEQVLTTNVDEMEYGLANMKSSISSLKTMIGNPADFPLSDTDVVLAGSPDNKVKIKLE